MIYRNGILLGKLKEELAYTLANCCNPEPGDKIFGFVTVNDGIRIHRNSCPNSSAIIKNFSYRVLTACWNIEDKVNKKGNCFIFENIDLKLYQEIIQSPKLIHTLDSRKFELLLADILQTFGYEIELTKQTRDGGIDIIALSKHSHFGKEKFLLEAKRWKNKVGVEPIRTLGFLHNHYKATKSCLATTSVFTNDAWKLHKELEYQLELKEGQDLLDWINIAEKSKKHNNV